MSKCFIISVVLNVVLIVGIFCARSYVRSKMFELAAINAEAEGRLARVILSELESGDPNGVEKLKERLNRYIEHADKTAVIWHSAAEG